MARGCLMCSYPASTIEMPSEVIDFQFELANFLALPDAVGSDLPPLRGHPQYITASLTGVLRSC